MNSKEIRKNLLLRTGLAAVALGGLSVAAPACSKPETAKPAQEIIISPAKTIESKTVIQATPTIKTPEASPLDLTVKKHVAKGESLVVDFGDIAVGDLNINGEEEVHDKKENTGVITILPNGGTVKATLNEGDVYHLKPGADRKKVLAQLEQEMRDKNPQIKTVTIQILPGDTLQGQTETPTTSSQLPNPAPSEIRTEDKGTFVEVLSGETKVVSNAVLSIDARVNGIKMHDDRGDTGAIVMIKGQATVFSEFGGSGHANFRTQAGLEAKTREILLQKLTEFREVTVNEVNINGNLISSVTYTRDGLLIDNIVDIRPDRIILINGQIIFQDNTGIDFNNRRQDRREGRR